MRTGIRGQVEEKNHCGQKIKKLRDLGVGKIV